MGDLLQPEVPTTPGVSNRRLQGSEREYIIVSFVRSTSQDEDVVTSVAKTAGDSVALQEWSWGSWKGAGCDKLTACDGSFH